MKVSDSYLDLCPDNRSGGLLKKVTHDFFNIDNEKCDFSLSHIFSDLTSMDMSAKRCAEHCLSKMRFFQPFANQCLQGVQAALALPAGLQRRFTRRVQ